MGQREDAELRHLAKEVNSGLRTDLFQDVEGGYTALLDSLVAQTRPPDEVVVAEGGSRDGTLERLRAYGGRLPLKIVEAPGANTLGGPGGDEPSEYSQITDGSCESPQP